MTVTVKKKIKRHKKKSPSNPNGANQFILDPRQNAFWDAYIDPKSKTFSNAYQSAIAVGYEENYAKTITATEWFIEKVRSINLLPRAEKVLEETLMLSHIHKNKINLDVLQVKLKTAQFIATTKGKDQGYTTKSEVDLTSKGKRLPAAQIVGMEIIREPRNNEDPV